MSTVNLQESKSKKPDDTAFKQQRLPAWRPILNAGSAWPIFLGIAVVFIPVGIIVLVFSASVSELMIDYTTCSAAAFYRNGSLVYNSIDGSNKNVSYTYVGPLYDNNTFQSAGSNPTCDKLINDTAYNSSFATCICYVNFVLPSAYPKPVYIYYGLTNFYQNHRRYVRARDDNQLAGRITNPADLNQYCDPFRYPGPPQYPSGQTSVGYAPCGSLANSLFTDRFGLYYYPNGTLPQSLPEVYSLGQRVKLNKKGIAWPSDKSSKYVNPSVPFDASKWAQPPNWQGTPSLIYGNDSDDVATSDNSQYGFQNEDLMNWMRTAALPTFRKLFRFVDHSSSPFSSNLPAGGYSLLVYYNYMVTPFGGTKRLIISSGSPFGGSGGYLIGCLYLFVGCLCLLLAVLCGVVHFLMIRSADREVRERLLSGTATAPSYGSVSVVTARQPPAFTSAAGRATHAFAPHASS